MTSALSLSRKEFDEDEEIFDPAEFLERSNFKEIIRYLPIKERVKCERVSKKWCELITEVNNSQTSMSIMGENVNTNITQNFCTHPQHRLWKHTHIVERNDWMTDISLVLKKVPNLKALHLRADDIQPILRDDEAEKIGKLLPNLEHFSLIDDYLGVDIFNDSIKMIKEMPNLFHLEMRFPCREGSHKTEMKQENLLVTDALEIFKGNIEILSTNVPLNSDNCRTLSSQCQKIRKLSLVGTTLPVPGLNSFLKEGGVRGKYLRCLSIVVDSEEQLELICSNMICLQSFHCVVEVKEKEKSKMLNIGQIGKLRNLKNLFLSAWCAELLDEGLLKVFLGCRQLSSLIINGEVSDKSFKLLADFLYFIKRIEINNGKKGDHITDESVLGFSKLEYLHALNLYYCEVSDDAVKALFANCKDLTYLRLTCNTKITNNIFSNCIEFCNEKPKEKVTIVLPDRLERYWKGYVPRSIPRNLVMQFL